MADQMKVEIATLDEALKANEEDIEKLQAKLLEARARQNSIVTRLQSAHNRLRVRELYAGEKVQDAFARFDLLERRVDLAEGRADAIGLGTQRRTLEAEIADLDSKDEADAELDAKTVVLQTRDCMPVRRLRTHPVRLSTEWGRVV